MTSCVCVHMCVCSACNRVILVATAVNGKISMKTDENILNLVCLHAFYVCMYMLFPLVTSFLLVDLFPLAKSILIMTYSLCCRMQFLLYFVNCFAWVVLRRAKANTHKGLSSLFKVRGNSTQIFRWYFSLYIVLLCISGRSTLKLFWLFRQICIILHARNTSKEIACKLKIDFRHISMLRKIFLEVLKVICIIFCCCCCCYSWQLQSSISALESHKTFYRGNRAHKRNYNNSKAHRI